MHSFTYPFAPVSAAGIKIEMDTGERASYTDEK